jgi:hypothetical protein
MKIKAQQALDFISDEPTSPAFAKKGWGGFDLAARCEISPSVLFEKEESPLFQRARKTARNPDLGKEKSCQSRA